MYVFCFVALSLHGALLRDSHVNCGSDLSSLFQACPQQASLLFRS